MSGDDFDRDVWSVLGLPVDAVDLEGAAARVLNAIQTRKKLSFVTPNVNWLVRASRDEAVRERIVDADLSLADGAPIVAMAKELGVPLKERCAGSDLFERLRWQDAAGRPPIRVFFFGGREGAGDAAVMAMNSEDSNMIACGAFNPGFGDVASMSDQRYIDFINSKRPDFVVVSLGAVKGQAWIDANKDRVEAPVLSHLGAVIDFVAGTIERAPEPIAASGLEWAWRIATEPSLWKRYATDGIGLAKLWPRRLAAYKSGLASLPRRGQPKVQITGRGQASLSGDIKHDGLSAVRDVFRGIAAQDASPTLNVSQLGAVDAAFIGQVLMLQKAMRRRDMTIQMSGLDPRHAELLRLGGIHFHCQPLRQDAPQSA